MNFEYFKSTCFKHTVYATLVFYVSFYLVVLLGQTFVAYFAPFFLFMPVTLLQLLPGLLLIAALAFFVSGVIRTGMLLVASYIALDFIDFYFLMRLGKAYPHMMWHFIWPFLYAVIICYGCWTRRD